MRRPSGGIPIAGDLPYQAGLLALTVAAVLLAIHHMPHSVWNDEGLTLNIIHRERWQEVVQGAMILKPFPPLFFFLTRVSEQMWPGHFGLRLVSLIFGILALVAVYRLGKLLLGRWQGLLSASLLVSTPGVFFHFVDANPYTILIFWSALSFELLARASDKSSKSIWIAYFLTALAGLASHSLFIFVLGGQWLFYLHSQFCSKGDSRFFSVDFWKERTAFLFSVGLLLLCWAAWIVFYFRNQGLATGPRPDLLSVPTLVSTIGLIPGPLTHSLWPHGAIFIVLLAAGVIRLWRFDATALTGLLLAWIPPAVGIALFAKATLPFISYRYGLGLFPITCLLASCAALPSGHRTPSRARLLAAAAPCIGFVTGFAVMAIAPSSYFTYSDWISCNRYLSAVAGPRDQIWFQNYQEAFPLEYYFGNPSRIVHFPYPQLASIPSSQYSAAQAEDLLKRHKAAGAEGGRIWVVEASFQNMNPWIERFTRTGSSRLGRRLHEINRRLEADGGLRLQRDRSFRRIQLYRLVRAVSAADCTDCTGPYNQCNLLFVKCKKL